MTEQVFFADGAYCAADQARVSVLDRGFLMGDALYEVVRVAGGRPFLAAEHFARLAYGMRELGFPPAMIAPKGPSLDEAAFTNLCGEMARRNNVRSGTVYVQVTRGQAPRSHVIPPGLRPNVVAFAREMALPSWRGAHPEGVSVVTVADERWRRCDIKTTMILPNSLAKQKAHEAGAHEAVLVGEDGVVHEGASSNLFAVRRGVVWTHPADRRILNGITRKVVLRLAKEEGLPVREAPFTVSDLLQAEEVFLTGTMTDVCPVLSVDGSPIAGGKSGPATRRLAERYGALLAQCGG